MKRLNNLAVGEQGEVLSLAAHGQERRRMLDLGLIPGTVVAALHRAPQGDPVAYFIRGTVIALRAEDAAKILISPVL